MKTLILAAIRCSLMFLVTASLFSVRPAQANYIVTLQQVGFEFQKSRQLFIRSRNETLSVVAMRVSNPDRSPVGINR